MVPEGSQAEALCALRIGVAERARLALDLRQAAGMARNRSAALVGIDSLNIDDTDDLTRPVHTILLGADIPIAEHLCNLGALPDSGFRFFAVPVKVKGFGTFTVRAFGVVG